MSIVAPPIVNKTTVKPFRSVCYDNNFVTSQGIFLGDDPLSFSLPLLLLEVSLIFVVSNALHFVLKPLGQSKVVAQILTGMLFGSTGFGRSLAFRRTVFPARATFILDTISMLSFILFLFSTGVKTDLGLLKKPGSRAIAVGAVGSLLPLFVSLSLFLPLHQSFPDDLWRGQFIFSLATRLSLSSFPVISSALDEHGLLNSDLGRMAVSAALITDVCNWGISSIITAVALVLKANSPEIAAATVGCFTFFTLFVIFVARPLALRMVRRTRIGSLMKQGGFVALIVGALLSALFTEVFGYHATLGPIMLGLALPGGMPIGATLTERLESFLFGIFLPIYLALAGYRTDITDLGNLKTWGSLELLVMICFFGKLTGSILAARHFKIPLKDAFILGLMTNIKGIVEVSYLNVKGDSELATAQHFSVLMISIVVITAVTMPLIKYLYDPNVRYVARKRRTIEHMKSGSDFRILAAVHVEDDVPPLLDLLDALHPHPSSPHNLHILHLTELAGRAASVLRPHRLRPRDTSNPTASDRITAAFRHFAEERPEGSILLQPFVAASPTSTMYNDVCSLALQRKARLVLLPFRRQPPGLSQAVLDHAPCSVAVLVAGAAATCAKTNLTVERVAVVFLGGKDDREALAIAGRMAEGGVEVTVVRVRGRGEPSAVEDEEAVAGVRRRAGVEYVESVVGDGEETVGVVRGMGERFDLVVVGRRKGLEGDEVTKGMEEWSQCPELGVLGDMLASAEISGRVAILVVQQQEWAAGNACQVEYGVADEGARDGLINKMAASV
ncbi:hypothetical protein HPP92_007400 [Vanilla planifolia]|uniref:Cation/H+ exchanger domain-containing protein n=1 Tax=Vanilla planifolia TaxID=51239 RepID=A0A835V9K6_VANPL|nr:hypothetical protein HPP92_007400 [Vanilla planifolia]